MSSNKQPPAADQQPPAAGPALTEVIWTQLGEDRGAHSEHGKHKAGETVKTAHAGMLIERGFAEAKK